MYGDFMPIQKLKSKTRVDSREKPLKTPRKPSKWFLSVCFAADGLFSRL
jgi:hypothetical protein